MHLPSYRRAHHKDRWELECCMERKQAMQVPDRLKEMQNIERQEQGPLNVKHSNSCSELKVFQSPLIMVQWLMLNY